MLRVLIFINTLVLFLVLFNYWQYKTALMEMKDQVVRTLQSIEKIATGIEQVSKMKVMDKVKKYYEMFKE